MIKVFPPSTTEFSRNGVYLNPTECLIHEEANEAYDLQMTVIRDEAGKWRYLTLGSILFVKAPYKNTPIKTTRQTEGIVTTYKTRGKATTKTEDKMVWVTPSSYWDPDIQDYVTPPPYKVSVGKVSTTTYANVPVYKDKACTTQSKTIPSGQTVEAIEEFDSCVFVIDKTGFVGYIKLSALTDRQQKPGQVTEIVDDADAQLNAMQPFRITSIRKSVPNHLIVSADHVYFDAAAEQIHIDGTGKELSAFLTDLNDGSPVTYHAGATAYLDKEYDGNRVSIINEICEANNFQLVRDGFDAYLIDAEYSSAHWRIHTGTGSNVTRLDVTQNTDSLVTRFIPVVDDKAKAPIDSPNIEEYALVYTERLKADSVAEAQEEAQKRFDEGCDVPETNIELQVVRGTLDRANIFDEVQLDDDYLDIHLTAKVNRVDYNPITEHIESLSIGEAKKRINTQIFAGVGGTWQKITER